MVEFSREELKSLIREQIPPCVSIYMPAYQTGTLVSEMPVRLKALLHQAEDQLRSLGTDKSNIATMLAPAQALLDDRSFWLEDREGLALFLSASPEAFRYYTDKSIAIQFPELLKVADRFHFKPLLPLLFGDAEFFILALSQQHVGLLRATRDTVRPVEFQRVPHNIGEALGNEVAPPQRQGHPMNVGGGEQTGVFGGYDPGEYEKDRLLRYFREVDHDVHHMIAHQNLPLVVVGLEYLQPLYRQVNTYPHLLENGVKTDADKMPAKELHQLAWPLIEPIFRKAREEETNRYRQLSDDNLTSNKLGEILQAAHFARIDTLFVESGKEQFGVYDAQTDRLEAHVESRPGDFDLLDDAATQTVLNGGRVYLVPHEQMPDPIGMVAAIFRY